MRVKLCLLTPFTTRTDWFCFKFNRLWSCTPASSNQNKHRRRPTDAPHDSKHKLTSNSTFLYMKNCLFVRPQLGIRFSLRCNCKSDSHVYGLIFCYISLQNSHQRSNQCVHINVVWLSLETGRATGEMYACNRNLNKKKQTCFTERIFQLLQCVTALTH